MTAFYLTRITMLCPMNIQNKSGKGLSKYDPPKYNMIQQLRSLLVATGHSLPERFIRMLLRLLQEM